MRNSFKKILTICLVFLFVFNFNFKNNTVDAASVFDIGNVSEVAGSIWDIFLGFMGDRAEEAGEEVRGIGPGDEDPDFLDSLRDEGAEAVFGTGGVGADSRTSGPLPGDPLFSTIGDDDNFQNDSLDPALLQQLNDHINRTAESLRATGFFNYAESTIGFTEEDLRMLLYAAYMRDIIGPVIDLESNQIFGSSDEIEFIVNPRYPRPGQSVTVSIQSFGINLDTSNIVWWHGGSVVHSGVGASILTDFILNREGTPENFKVVIRKSGGGVIEKSFQIHPAEVDIIFESNTYVPPFYQGKPAYSHNSVVKFIAIPTVLDQNGRLMNVSDFRYRWYVNNKIVSNSAWIGKNYFYYEDDFTTRSITVSVDIEGLNSDFKTLKGIKLSPVDTEIVLYEESPLYGPIFERAITNDISTASREINIRAVPFYFSRGENLTYKWSLGNRNLSNFVSSVITFRAVDDKPILSSISVLIDNPRKIGQSAYKFFSLLVNN